MRELLRAEELSFDGVGKMVVPHLNLWNRTGEKIVKITLEKTLPAEIEQKSFEIIDRELQQKGIILQPENELVIKRAIHTSADFDYAENLWFSEQAVARGLEALRQGASIVTDTQMAKSGINKKRLQQFGGEVFCFMSDEEIARAAKQNGTTRAVASMNRAAELDRALIFAIGNAPTALVRLYELIQEKKILPKLIIGVPVGFVNVVESKELILQSQVPCIVARGRKGGSNIAAAICNALLYQL